MKFDGRLETQEFDRKIADVEKEKILHAKMSQFFKAGGTRKLRMLLFRKNFQENMRGSREPPPPAPEKFKFIKFRL